ncbi:MAG: site-specific integrase [Oscillibacter sp.]|nr:site-specific integrase [Oscillibacter sp.]
MGKQQTGHIRQRGNGLWEGQYIYERERRSIYGRTREAVSRQLTEIITSIEEGNYIRPNQHTLLSWLREWLNSYAKPTLRPATFTNYEMTIERHFNTKLGRVKLKNVSTRMLQDFFNKKLILGRADKKSGGLSAKTLKNMKYMLHVALDQAYYDKLISSNPVDGVRLPVPDGPEQRVLRPEEKERICAHAATIHTFPAQGVILLLTCGLRRGELLGLQWQDVDLEKGIIKIRHTLSRLQKFDINRSAYQYIQLDTYAPKTNQTAIYLSPVKTKKVARTIYLPVRAQKAFLEIRTISEKLAEGKPDFTPHNLVFCTEEGHPLEVKVLEDGFQQILVALQIKSVNLHATRHTFATEALQKTTDIVTVSEVLGHARPSTTLDMYGHTFDDRKRALMEQM